MKYLTIIIHAYLNTYKIRGVDGNDYELKLFEPITLPYLNAKIFLDRGLARLVISHPYQSY